MVRLTRWIVGVTIFTASLAIGATTFAGLQWWEAHTGAKTVEKQANAAVDLARAARDQAKAATDQIAIAKDQVAAAKETAGIGRAQLTQNGDLFAAQQRPIVQFDPADPHSKRGIVEVPGGLGYSWFYAFKNIGQGPAYDVETHEAISVFGRRPQTNWRRDPGIFAQGEERWAQATYVFKDDEKRGLGDPAPRISVTFDYRDGQGRRWSSGFCRQLGSNGSIGVC